MDPISAILLLGASVAGVGIAQESVSATSRTRLAEVLGMAVRRPRELELPDEPPELPLHVHETLWELFEYENSAIIDLTGYSFPSSKEEMDAELYMTPAGTTWHTWKGRRSTPWEDRSPSLWDRMHAAFVGHAPPLRVHIAMTIPMDTGNQDVVGAFVFSVGVIDIEIWAYGDDIEVLAESLAADSELEELMQHCLSTAFGIELDVARGTDRIKLAHEYDALEHDSFREIMVQLSERITEMGEEAEEAAQAAESTMDKIFVRCDKEVHEELMRRYREQEEEEDEDDEEDDWEED